MTVVNKKNTNVTSNDETTRNDNVHNRLIKIHSIKKIVFGITEAMLTYDVNSFCKSVLFVVRFFVSRNLYIQY